MAQGIYLGSVDVAKSVGKIYVGVDGVAREVVKGYVGVGGVAQEFFSSFVPSTEIILDYWTLDSTLTSLTETGV